MDDRFELPIVGEILVEEFLEPLNITPYRLSKDLEKIPNCKQIA